MRDPSSSVPPSCIAHGVAPLVTELDESIEIYRCGHADDERGMLETMVATAFRSAYGAEVTSFYPQLLGFTTGTGLRAVVGYRDGLAQPLFSEQYLDATAEQVMSRHLYRDVVRGQVAEVGNLALCGPGQARWVIAAATVFLHAAGYRWVLFTAVRHLVNAFQRLGLRPVPLAAADPGRLPDGGASWGSYYDASPMVCAGDIGAGLRKLTTSAALRQPRLQALLDMAHQLGGAAQTDAGATRLAARSNR
jgi:hypothetical protein